MNHITQYLQREYLVKTTRGASPGILGIMRFGDGDSWFV